MKKRIARYHVAAAARLTATRVTIRRTGHHRDMAAELNANAPPAAIDDHGYNTLLSLQAMLEHNLQLSITAAARRPYAEVAILTLPAINTAAPAP